MTTALLFMFSFIMIVIINYYQEIKDNPCQICSKKLGTNVYCTATDGENIPVTRTYYPNGTISDNTKELIEIINRIESEIQKENRINFSKFNISINLLP